MQRMFVVMPQLSGYGSVLHTVVSLPLVPQLVDGRKYLATAPPRDVRVRGPNMVSLVRSTVRREAVREVDRRFYAHTR